MEQSVPFAMGACFLFCVPFALIWMFFSWCQRSFLPRKDPAFIAEPERLDIVQNRDRSAEANEDNFIHSPAFAMTALLLTVLGLPTAISLILFQALGVDKLLEVCRWTIAPCCSWLKLYYFCGLGCAFATLFMRAWFTFPLPY